MARRARGTGTIAKRKDGRVDCEITLTTAGGKRRFRTTKNNEFEADRWLSRIKRDHELGRLNTDTLTLTFGDYLERWLKDSVEGTVSRNTFHGYESKVRLYLKPALGYIKLRELRADHLQALYRKLADEGKAARTVRYVHTTASKALHQAEAWDLVPKNVARFARPPKPEHKERPTMTPAEVKRFMEAIRGDRHEALYLLAVTTGLRRGELFGLRWEDIDLEESVLRVRRSLDTAFTPPRENPPKRRASQRPAVIFPEVAAALREHRKRQLEARMIAGPRWQESGYVFATRYGTPYRAGNVLTDSLKPLCKRAGLREFNFQALRRSSCTFLAMLGVDPKTAQRIMGHSSIVTTLSYYTEVLDEMHGAASDKMRAFLFNPS